MRRAIQRDMHALFLLRKASAVLNLLTTGINHENYTLKKKFPKGKNPYNKVDMQYTCTKECNKSTLNYCDKSTHAEEMAIDKLRKNNKPKLIDISLLVIKITPASTIESYRLSNSRPCIACMYKIKNITYSGYRLSKIYFPNENGQIICYKLRDILKEKQYVSKYYRLATIPKSYLREFEIDYEKLEKIKKCKNPQKNKYIKAYRSIKA